MKLDPHLPQLPSISELLEHPRVKGVVARINRSTLVHRASGFLEELKWSLVERKGRIEIPSVTQIAERLARRLLGEPLNNGPIINATGIVVGDPDLAPPLADAAVHAMVQIAGEYHGRGAELHRALEVDLCRLTGAESAIVVNSFGAALNMVLASTAANRELLVSDMLSQPEASIEWRKLAARHAAVLRTSAGDVESLSSASKECAELGALIRSPEVEGWATTKEIASIAKRCGASFIDVCPSAGVLNPEVCGLQSTETLRERLVAGADLVITDGAGFLGGPACGVIAGKRALVESAAAHYLAPIAVIDAATAAAMHATLAAYSDDDRDSALFSIPIWQLLSTPHANLKQRAERFGALIAAAPGVASAEALEVEGPWRRSGRLLLAARTWVIAVRPKSGDAATLTSRLRQRAYPIAANNMNDAVWLDLRSVFPRWDQQLVAAFETADT